MYQTTNQPQYPQIIDVILEIGMDLGVFDSGKDVGEVIRLPK